jgi:hypothetical protein
MNKRITKAVSITIHKGKVYLHLTKCRPVIISAEDKFRKGIEFKICAKCKCFTAMTLFTGRRDYCAECGLEVLQKMKVRP